MNEPGTGRPVVKHTPGPWEWWTSNSWKRLRRTERGVSTNILMPCRLPDGGATIDVTDADMALIAAAPTMFTYVAERADAGDAKAKEILEAINAGR